MSAEHAEYHHDGSVPPINRSLGIQAFARPIDTAQQNGALFFLAMQLDLIVSKRPKRNRPVTAAEWEVVIIQAAKAMVEK